MMKDIRQGTLEGGRKRGRPRINYHLNIKEWTGLSIPAIYSTARRTDDWRDVLRQALRGANADDGRPRRTTR